MRSFIFLILFPFMVLSQAPGYMGNRWSAGYGFNVSPAFSGATPRGGNFNTVHEFYGDYAIATKWLMGASARFYKTIYNNSATITDMGVSPESYYTIHGLTLALNFKYYKQNYVAPWGKYFMMSPVLNAARTSYDPYMHIREKVNNHDTLLTDFGPSPQTFYHFDLMLGWGRTRVIAHRVTLDYGFNIQLWSMLSYIGELDFTGTAPVLTPENYIEETHTSRVHGINRFNVFIKVGYLF